MDFLILGSLVLAGFLIGILSAMVGIGGGLVTVPVLMFLYGLDNPTSSAISTVVIVATSISGTMTYLKHRRIDLRTGAYFSVIAVPSAFVGGLLADNLPAEILTTFFGVLMILVSLRKVLAIIREKKSSNGGKKDPTAEDPTTEDPTTEDNSSPPVSYGWVPQSVEERTIVDNEGKRFTYQVRLRNTLLGALFGGLIGGMLGVGGGVIFVPVLNSIGGVPPHVAVATSTFTIVFASSSGAVARILGGKVMFDYVIALALGSVFGARLGALKVRRIDSQKVLLLFYFIVFLSGVRTILKGLGYM